MKKFLPLIFLLPFFCQAGDWDLFRLNQTNFYTFHYFISDLNVGVQIMDSVKQNGTEDILYFHRNLQYENAGQCYQSAYNSLPPVSIEIDSLVQRNDSVFYSWNGSTLPFYFLTNAVVGQSWIVTSTYSGNDYNQITITCVNIQEETFFGINDSVKTFTMTPNGTSQNQVPVNNFVIKLSKYHGLIEYVPFYLFLYHPANTNFFSSKLIGIDSTGVTYGFQRPDLQNYFHLNVGDVLMWKHEYSPASIMDHPWQEFYWDSITQVFSSMDSVIYDVIERKLDTHNVVTQYSKIMKFLKTDRYDLLQAPTGWIAFQDGPYNFFPFWAFHFPVTLWNYQHMFLKTDSLTNDTIWESDFESEAYGLDTLNCQVITTFDIGLSFTLNTRMGITSYCYYNFSLDCYTLTGGIIDGLQYGFSELPVDIKEISENNSVSIYPNPFHTTAKLENSNWKTGTGDLKIYDSMGSLIRKDKIININSYILHREGLKNGLYYFQLSTPDIQLISTGKFIIE